MKFEDFKPSPDGQGPYPEEQADPCAIDSCIEKGMVTYWFWNDTCNGWDYVKLCPKCSLILEEKLHPKMKEIPYTKETFKKLSEKKGISDEYYEEDDNL